MTVGGSVLAGGRTEPPYCPMCDGPCTGHFERGPYVLGGPMPEQGETVPAPHRIVDDERGVVLYGVGEPVPYDEAVRLGLVGDGPVEPKPKAAKKGTRTRARTKPAEEG